MTYRFTMKARKMHSQNGSGNQTPLPVTVYADTLEEAWGKGFTMLGGQKIDYWWSWALSCSDVEEVAPDVETIHVLKWGGETDVPE